MLEKRVAILMSTYNGEKYLEDQINSIINQTYSNWHLYIRDDGSTDNTQLIIKKYSDNYRNITFFNENKVKNVGVVVSFMSLLENVNADFYMFSDQDDVWKKDKVKKEVNAILDCPYETKPVCIHTDLQVVNAELQGDKRMNGNNIWHSFQHLLFTNCVTGCTMLVNQALKNMIDFNDLDYSKIYMHDWWCALICAEFGEIVYLNEPTILYRQHEDNVVGSNKKNTIQHVIYRLTHQGPERDHVKRVVRISEEFDKHFGEKMHGKDYEYVHSYGEIAKRSSFGRNLMTGLRLVPQRLNLKGKIFFTYLMTVYNKSIRDLEQ